MRVREANVRAFWTILDVRAAGALQLAAASVLAGPPLHLNRRNIFIYSSTDLSVLVRPPAG